MTTVSNYTALRAHAFSVGNECVFIQGCSSISDLRQSLFFWNASLTDSVNDGTINITDLTIPANTTLTLELEGPGFYVMNTKWKTIAKNQLSVNYLISRTVRYQQYAYRHKSTSGFEEPRLLIIYPLNDRFRKPLQPFYCEITDGQAHLKLAAFPFDLSGDRFLQVSEVTNLLDASDSNGQVGNVIHQDAPAAKITGQL